MKMLKWNLTLFTIWLSHLHGAAAQSTCKPAEEGQPYSLLCEVSRQLDPIILWESGTSFDDFYCQCRNDDQSCLCYKPGVKATLSVSGNIVISNFTIYSPHRNQTGTTWTCLSEGSVIKTCDFHVFARAKNVACRVQDPGPTSNTDVTVRCQTEDIYPSITCLFQRKTNDSIRTNLTAGTNGVTVETGDKSCTLRVPGSYLGRGAHQFGVVMYPIVTGGQADIEYGETSPDTTSIKIGDPSAELRDCPTAASDGSVLDDYIKEGTSHTCTCTRTDQTYFPVDISWKDKNGGTLSNVTQQDQSATLMFTAAKGQAFTCTVTNSLQWSKEVVYTPQLVLPPSIRTFKASNMINEVSVRNNSEVQFSCEAEGRPSPRLSLYKEDHGTEERLASVDSGILAFSKTVTCGDTGLYKCNAEVAESEASEGIRVYVLCALKLEIATSQNKVYRGEVSETLDIIVPVIGYPGPTYLSLAGEQNVLDDGSYTVMFFDVDSSSGIIYIKFYDLNDELFQKYSLNITSSQGSFVYSFEIRAGDEEDTEVNAGAVIGGVVAGLLVVNAVVVAVVCVYRKGLLSSCGKREDTSDGTYMNTIPCEDKDLPYQNAHNVSGEENMTSSHYETVTDDQATSATDIPRVETDTEQTGPYENTL